DRQPTDATAAERKRRQRQKERDGRDSHAVTSVTVTPIEEREERGIEVEIDQRSLTSLQITTSEGFSVEDVKAKGWTPPKHCAVSRDKKHVYIWTNTPEWDAYAADYRAVHQQEP